MEFLVRCPQLTAITAHHVSSTKSFPTFSNTFNIKRNCVCYAKTRGKDNDDDNAIINDPIFTAAMQRVCIRHQETLRPEPLFLDPYIGCLMPSNPHTDTSHGSRMHCLATKFIDDKLLETIKKTDGLRQVILFTDGMDTRPYRLNWPPSTLIFDVSPERIYKRSIQRLEDIGAKIRRGSMFFHVPAETYDIERVLRSKGYNGTRPSIWAFQDFPTVALADFKEILSVVSNLAMKGSVVLGEFPLWLADTDIGIESTKATWIDKLFMSHGLKANIIDYDQVVAGKEVTIRDYNNILFLAQQLQYSDVQMEVWRREFQRIEDEGDEEGFEEL